MSVAQIVKLLQITYISVKGLYKWVLLSNCIANALKKGFFLTLGFRRLFVLPFREQLMEKWIKTRQINQGDPRALLNLTRALLKNDGN